MQNYMASCEEFARAAGEALLQWQGRFTVREKGRADLVTEADLASQRLIQGRISAEYPGHRFVGEEDTPASDDVDAASEFCWYVDPLDGTTNYVHGLPGWCVSIALTQDGKRIAGCVYDPVSQSCFTAGRDLGAYCNGEPLRASETDELKYALVAISLPASVRQDSPEVAWFLELLPEIQAFRRLGSAALNLCYVASGQLDAYWAGSIHPWDFAAGTLIVEEAGGVISTLPGEPLAIDSRSIVAASNHPLHQALVERLGRAGRHNR